ncbi:MAG: DNA polymerase III subunit epsilon [Phyllobacteriaceae bacterium]|nr:DNA polymerase III subunit epsilon [Phyllobacteriaceae bacterium]
MREIIFDTETTGLDSREDRIIEIGGLELVNRFPSGRTFHVYLNPQGRNVHPDAQAVHGISNADLADKPAFHEIVGEFLEFVADAKLVAHNATFDMGFVNAELTRIGELPIGPDRVIDTLAIARRKHPMGPNSLDALCKRYGVDNSRRSFHGALLDAELLADVYIELMGGKQAALGLETAKTRVAVVAGEAADETIAFVRERRPRLSDAEREAHDELVKRLGDNAIWKRIAG